MDTPAVSIIVPVYDAGDYLKRCVDSILGQGYTDFEVLLIDDGSSDDSGGICDQYAGQDSRIRVFHKENGGVSSARNLGLQHSKGEWICFVDADDMLMPSGLDTMMAWATEDVDLVMAGYREWDGEVLQQDTLRFGHDGVIDRDKALLMMYPYTVYPFMGYAWGKLFRADLISKMGLSFDERIVIKEDTLFVVEYLCGITSSVYYTPMPVYQYLRMPTGVMGGLRLAYNPKYLTSFDAAVKMHRLVQGLPAISKSLDKAAKFEVVNRIYRVYGHMLSNGVDPKRFASGLTRRAVHEVGLCYYLEYQVWRNKRRLRNYLIKLLHRGHVQQ